MASGESARYFEESEDNFMTATLEGDEDEDIEVRLLLLLLLLLLGDYNVIIIITQY